jgi:hypothetical protein
MTDKSKPKKQPAAGVFVLMMRITGDPRKCRRFAKLVADQAETEYCIHMTSKYSEMSYDANLTRWEKL